MALVVNLCKFPLTSHPCMVLFLTAGSACLPYPSFCSNWKISKGIWESFAGRTSRKKTRISPSFPDGFLFVCVLAFLFVSLFALLFPGKAAFWPLRKIRVGGLSCIVNKMLQLKEIQFLWLQLVSSCFAPSSVSLSNPFPHAGCLRGRPWSSIFWSAWDEAPGPGLGPRRAGGWPRQVSGSPWLCGQDGSPWNLAEPCRVNDGPRLPA